MHTHLFKNRAGFKIIVLVWLISKTNSQEWRKSFVKTNVILIIENDLGRHVYIVKITVRYAYRNNIQFLNALIHIYFKKEIVG